MVIKPELNRFLTLLHETFGGRRLDLLEKRRERDRKLQAGEKLAHLESTRSIRNADWKVTSVPHDLQRRTVEITGPAEPKMIINALNSGANVFMADLEDSLSPTWERIQEGHDALHAAVRHNLELRTSDKVYKLNAETATLVVRPRGLHMTEHHFSVEGTPISASLFDFGIYFFNNAKELLARGTGPYFYIPKLESHHEAAWWSDVFEFSEKYLDIPPQSIKATVLIETAPAAFEMEEILFELRKYIVGLNAGRWDYIFSWIKKFHHRKDMIFPDRAQITMTVPFMKNYCDKIVDICHKRGAHAMGGMSAFIPNRKEPEVTAAAIEKVRADKQREVTSGFDGTWVAHPDLIPIAREEFTKVIGEAPHQKHKLLGRQYSDPDLGDTFIEGGKITEAGVRNNLFVAVVYIDHWINGTGAVSILNLMEDAATAEISRSQLWQWIHHGVTLDDGHQVSKPLIEKWLKEETARAEEAGLLKAASVSAQALGELIFNSEFTEFLTLKCDHLLRGGLSDKHQKH